MVELDYLRNLVALMKSEGVSRLKADGVELEMAPSLVDYKPRLADDHDYSDPDILNDPYTFGGPSAGVPAFRQHD